MKQTSKALPIEVLESILGALALTALVLLQSTKKPLFSGLAEEQQPDFQADRENDVLAQKD